MEHSLLALQRKVDPNVDSAAGVEHTSAKELATKRLKQSDASPIYMVDDSPPGKHIAFQGKPCTADSILVEVVQSGFNVEVTLLLSSRCHLWCGAGHATPPPTQPVHMSM